MVIEQCINLSFGIHRTSTFITLQRLVNREIWYHGRKSPVTPQSGSIPVAPLDPGPKEISIQQRQKSGP